MNDLSSLMQMAQSFAGAARSPAGGYAERVTLALLAAGRDSCACKACDHLRAVVALMEQSLSPPPR